MKRLIEKADVERAVNDLVAKGKKVTNNGIYEALGKKGSLTTIVKLLKEIAQEKEERLKGKEAAEKIPGGKKGEEMIERAVERVMREKVRGMVRDSFLELVEESLGVLVQQMVLNAVRVIETGTGQKPPEEGWRERFEGEIREEVKNLRGEIVELMESMNQVLAEGNVLMGYLGGSVGSEKVSA